MAKRQETDDTETEAETSMTDDRCTMCTRPTMAVTGLCGYCVKHKCKPENVERIRAKRTAAYRAHNALADHLAELDRKYKPVAPRMFSGR